MTNDEISADRIERGRSAIIATNPDCKERCASAEQARCQCRISASAALIADAPALAAAYARGKADGLREGREDSERIKADNQARVDAASSATATTWTFNQALANYIAAGAVGGALEIIAAIDARIAALGKKEAS